jgi:hypothetical protein
VRCNSAGRAPRAVAALGVVALLGSCSGSEPDYMLLQDAMKSHISDVDHRPVQTVDCLPHVDGTQRGETAHLKCVVTFSDGTSYQANATIQNENTGGAHNLPDTYGWDAPPAS